MSKLNASALTEEEIEEELINNDLIHSGGIKYQTELQQMDLEEKKSLLRSIKQSKEDFQKETSCTTTKPLKKPIIIDTSSTEFPSLASVATKSNKLKLPRRQSAASKSDSDNSSEPCISLVDDDDESIFPVPKKFNLPFCVSDNAPPLSMPDRAFKREKCPYFQMRGELGIEALRRMLAHHDAWKDKYNTETRKLESRALVENIQEFDNKEFKNGENGDDENDPYTFKEVTKVYSAHGSKKRETNKILDNNPSPNSRTLQRRASRDSDCEEVQPILKPEEPKLGEWMSVARPRNKRNRKQTSNQDRAQSQPDIEFGFDNTRSLWGPGQRSGGPQSPAPSRRSIPMPSVPEEEKVECPICQREFARSTVETHAANCEGFSSSPMDVEEGT